MEAANKHLSAFAGRQLAAEEANLDQVGRKSQAWPQLQQTLAQRPVQVHWVLPARLSASSSLLLRVFVSPQTWPQSCGLAYSFIYLSIYLFACPKQPWQARAEQHGAPAGLGGPAGTFRRANLALGEGRSEFSAAAARWRARRRRLTLEACVQWGRSQRPNGERLLPTGLS